MVSSSVQESGITYDKNGNLKTLNRAGAVTDQLIYFYAGTGNRLSSIADGSGDNNGVRIGTHTFDYDENGNMTKDGSKNADITCNVLNLPSEVKVGNNLVAYLYDGSGTKLKMSSPGNAVLYSGAFEFGGDGALRRIGLEEGQLVRNSSGNYEVHYYLRDHLGNVRMVLKEDGSVLQETEYYAFGLPVIRYGNDAVNKYLFNGKEKQPETGWLDYGARMCMAEIRKWGTADPLSEQGRRWSPYNYAFNNPIRFIDPDGKLALDVIIIFNKSNGKLSVTDRDHYQKGLPAKVVSANNYVHRGIRDSEGKLTHNQVLLMDNFFSGGIATDGVVERDPNRPMQKSIPNGEYDLLDNDADTKHTGWFRLDSKDNKRYNDYDDAT